jgi:hypothetical protein
MAALDSQPSYWNTTGTSKTFTHPIESGGSMGWTAAHTS